MNKHLGAVVFVLLFWLITTLSNAVPSSAPSPTMDQVVDRAVEREHALMNRAPLFKNSTPSWISVGGCRIKDFAPELDSV